MATSGIKQTVLVCRLRDVLFSYIAIANHCCQSLLLDRALHRADRYDIDAVSIWEGLTTLIPISRLLMEDLCFEPILEGLGTVPLVEIFNYG